jgi:hypothetical protein
MLSQIVRPMVQTQVRLLAHSRSTRATLVSAISQWLGFIGVQAQVSHLYADSGQIHISLTVDRPDACDPVDWDRILGNLAPCGSPDYGTCAPANEHQFTPHQQHKVQRLLAYLIQVGDPKETVNWDILAPQLQTMGFDQETLMGIRSALKVPQSLEDLVEGLDPDVAAIALPKAVSLAIMDRQVNHSEDQALMALLKAIKQT